MSSSENLKIPLQEILSATNKFAEANVIGKGAFGEVYRGQVIQHGLVAIKRLKTSSTQGIHEYGMEISVLSKYKHENLVSLIGFCGEDGERILVYKYEANQSLDRFLGSKDLSWMHRLRICLGAARGLRYLHDEIGTGYGVIHRDIKSSNILLDENWNAKISDFGLSKIVLTNSADSVIFTAPCGTNGYVDPQILYGCGITQKSDVYSFGVVLFEVLFGKLVTLPGDGSDGRFTVKIAKKHYKEKTLRMMIDPYLRNEMDFQSFSMFSSIAHRCLKKHIEDRPTMSMVVESLEKALSYHKVTTREGVGLFSSGFLHDVYISYKPESNILVTCLCDALKREGLSTALKSDTLDYSVRNPLNESILVSAIQQSRAFIIVFAKYNGKNSWNQRDEVAEIMNCVKERGNFVIPVFFDLDPSYIRKKAEPIDSFLEWIRYDSWRTEEWKNPLVEAINIPGLELSDFRDSKHLAQEVASTILRQLQEER